MEKYITDKRTGPKYELVSDYYLIAGAVDPVIQDILCADLRQVVSTQIRNGGIFKSVIPAHPVILASIEFRDLRTEQLENIRDDIPFCVFLRKAGCKLQQIRIFTGAGFEKAYFVENLVQYRFIHAGSAEIVFTRTAAIQTFHD